MEEHLNSQPPSTKPELQEPLAPEITPEKTLFQNPPTASLPPEEHKPIIFIILIPVLIIIIGVILLTFVLKNKNQSTKTISPTPASKTTLVPTQKMGISTEWQTFLSIYSYSLKYPATWQIYKADWEEENQPFNLQQDDEAIIRFREPNQPAHSGDPYGVTISLKKPAENINNLSARDWMKENYPAFSFIKTEDTTVAGIKSVKVTTLVGGKYIYVLIPYNRKIYQLVNHPYTTKDSPATAYQNLYDYENIFNQILSTVEFLKTCDSCPLFTPPRPDWCNDGKIVAGEDIYHNDKDCYCPGPPKCEK